MAIGRAFYLGEEVSEDNVEAVKWFELAANQGNTEAQYYLGECHLKGFGVPENEQKGVEFLREAAAKGNANAIEMLFENGFELEKEIQSEMIQKDGPVIEVFGEFESRARTLYSKTVSSNSISNKDDKSNVVDLQTKRLERLNNIMGRNE